MKSFLFATVCAASVLAANASAETITFNTAPPGTLTTYSESGYTVQALSGGDNTYISGYGNPNSSIFADAQNASFQITRTTGFSFASFDVDNGSTNTNVNDSYSVVGFLGATQVFNQSGTKAGGPFGNFSTINSGATATIDRLVFTVTAFSGGLNFDNITVSDPVSDAVPEPAT